MAHISRLYDFQAGTKIMSSQVDAEFNQGITKMNSLDDTFTALATSSGATTVGVNTIDTLPATNLQAFLVAMRSAILASLSAHSSNISNPHSVTKSQVGLGNADNTSDTNKPVSTAQATALALKSDKSVTDLHYKGVTYNSSNGQFTFIKESGATTVVDTMLEKIVTNWAYDADTQSMVVTLADGTTQSVSLSAFIAETEYADTSSIDLSVVNHILSAVVKPGGITSAMLATEVTDTLTGYVTQAGNSASSASASATAADESEANASTYASNASTSASQASTSATNASASASGASTSASQASTSATNAGNSAGAAATSAGNASTSASNSEASKQNSEAYAVGKRNGTDVSSGDAAYHNNSKYYSEQASTFAGNASTSATNAGTSETNAATSAATAVANAGVMTVVSNGFAIANGSTRGTLGVKAVDEGYETSTSQGALGAYSHAEGNQTTTLDSNTHAEGYKTVASGISSHAEGSETQASGYHSHAEGSGTHASSLNSHAEGNGTTASGQNSHAEGNGTVASNTSAHAEGYGYASGDGSHAEGSGNASGDGSHAEGSGNASGNGSHAEGNGKAGGDDSHAEGLGRASGLYSHAEGEDTNAEGQSSHTEGLRTFAIGDNAHAEGLRTWALVGTLFNITSISGNQLTLDSVTGLEVDNQLALFAHGELGTYLAGVVSISAIDGNVITVPSSTDVFNFDSVTKASLLGDSYGAHAEGYATVASGANSHSEGYGTIASGEAQHAGGKYNIADTTSLEIIGNGTADTARSNARTLDASGNEVLAGTIQPLGGYKSVDGTAGATGSFTSADGKTVTVKDGLIVSIA